MLKRNSSSIQCDRATAWLTLMPPEVAVKNVPDTTENATVEYSVPVSGSGRAVGLDVVSSASTAALFPCETVLFVAFVGSDAPEATDGVRADNGCRAVFRASVTGSTSLLNDGTEADDGGAARMSSS